MRTESVLCQNASDMLAHTFAFDVCRPTSPPAPPSAVARQHSAATRQNAETAVARPRQLWRTALMGVKRGGTRRQKRATMARAAPRLAAARRDSQ